MARSQKAPRIPAPSLTAADRLDARASRHGGARRVRPATHYRRLICCDRYHILRLARWRDPGRTQGSRRMAVSRPSPAVPDDRQTAKRRPKRKFRQAFSNRPPPTQSRDTLCRHRLLPILAPTLASSNPLKPVEQQTYARGPKAGLSAELRRPIHPEGFSP
jgi:hypothetical protein